MLVHLNSPNVKIYFCEAHLTTTTSCQDAAKFMLYFLFANPVGTASGSTRAKKFSQFKSRVIKQWFIIIHQDVIELVTILVIFYPKIIKHILFPHSWVLSFFLPIMRKPILSYKICHGIKSMRLRHICCSIFSYISE